MKANKLCFSYGLKKIIKDISLEIESSKIGILVGDSGCGKTTLLNLISGILSPHSGSLEGVPDIVYQSQEIRLLPYLTAIENLILKCRLRENMSSDKKKLATYLYNHFGLPENSLNQFPSELSGGMRQRIAIIQSLLVDSPVLLMDEPLSAVDRATSVIIMDYIAHHVRTNNVSALIVTHDLEQAVSLGDYIFLMNARGELDKLILSHNTTLPSRRRDAPEYTSNFLKLVAALNQL